MERDEAYDLLDEIKQNYPNINVSEIEVDRHFEHLADMPLDIALNNVRMHVKASVYPPKIAEIRLKARHSRVWGLQPISPFSCLTTRFCAAVTAPTPHPTGERRRARRLPVDRKCVTHEASAPRNHGQHC